MKKLLLIFSLIFGVNVKAETIGDFDVRVEISQPHPILVDHERFLVIEKGRDILGKIKLYPDVGSRVPLNVFDNGDEYVFVDCNGTWYGLIKANGKTHKYKWQWLKPLPAIYLGTFRLRVRDKVVSFKKENIELSSVYLYKDPI